MESFTPRLVRTGAAPLYRQLYGYIVREITAGTLAAGERLPSKRRLAADLHVSVSTVETAYQMLAAEGYVHPRAKSGFTVCRIERLAAPERPVPALPAEAPAARWRYDFATGSVDTALFPFKTWARLQRETLTAHPELLNHGPRQGDFALRAAIAKHLHAYRGVVCAPEQVVVGAGIEYLVGLLARLFSDSVFAVENPGYARTAHILRNNGVRTVFVPVDESGMRVDALAQSGAQLAYVTPSHQFPTGATMPVTRRTALLRWAREWSDGSGSSDGPGGSGGPDGSGGPGGPGGSDGSGSSGGPGGSEAPRGPGGPEASDGPEKPGGIEVPGGSKGPGGSGLRERYVIEDDYDSEFRYDTRPIPSLQGLDGAGRVIYVSTFSKSVAPSMRIGYMVLPVPLLQRYREEYSLYSSTVSRFEQQVLCRFLEEGHFARHLNRLRGAYRARRDALLEALYEAFGREGVTVRGSHTGLHLLATLPGSKTEAQLVQAAAACGVHVNGLSSYYMEHSETCPPATVVLGFSDLDEADLREAVALLKTAWR